jgi:hypothetical protein
MSKDPNDPGTVDILDPSMVGAAKYERVANDLYETPAWVTEVLLRHVRFGQIWEPARGNGAMQDVIQSHGIKNIGTDLPNNFLDMGAATAWDVVTNPPYKHADEFVRHALAITKTHKRKVAMLLRNEWDCAKGRRDILADHPAYTMKIVLLRRPRWFEKKAGDASPRHNYAWYVWDWMNHVSPNIVYDR